MGDFCTRGVQKSGFSSLLFSFFLLAASLPAQAATYYVSPSGNDANSGASLTLAKQTIQAAINVAVAGDTVLVADGTYAPITINQGITVRSVNGAQSTIIDGGGVTRCVFVATNAVLDGFMVMNGYSFDILGGGIHIYGGMVQNCIISGNVAVSWGAIGGVRVWGGTLQNCAITGNSADYYGGGVGVLGGIVLNCDISGNSAQYGGGVSIGPGGTVQNCIISGNSADVCDGGVTVDPAGTIQNCKIYGNSAYYGSGGVTTYGGTVQNCMISGNSVNHQGGGVYVWGGLVENCTISGNTAIEGGGVYVLGGTVQNCTITGNIAGWAGGVFDRGGTVRNCMIDGNTADWFAGGVRVWEGGLVENCTISGNTARNKGGGGVDVWFSMVENCTISGNTAAEGGGVYIGGGTVRNCIAYYNQNGDVYSYNYSPISYSCIGTDIGGIGNITNAPQFVSLGTGYGTNHVPGNYRLQPASPCINAGLNQTWMAGAIDLDGLPRIMDGVVDMGAYEGLGANNAIMRNPAILYNQCSYGSNVASQTIEVWNAGTNTMPYALSADVGWISLSPAIGTSTGEIDLVSVNYATAGLLPGTYTGIVTIASAEAINSPQLVTVYLSVNEVPQEDLADLEASDFRFLPVNLWAGDHPAMISFDLVNEGPEDIVAPDTQLEIAFYLSSNTIFGDSDDLTIGTKSEEITLSAGAQTTIRYPGRAHNTDITVPEGLSGDFYVFVSVRLVSQVGLTDPDGAVAMREGPIQVRIHPSDDGDDPGGGGNGKQRSVLNDYDADGQSDMVDYDEESGEWTIKFSASGAAARFIFGGSDYEAVPGDYDGDFKADPAVHDGQAWQIMLSGLGYETVSFGFDVGAETRGAVGDYNGDELADPGLYEEQSGRWYVFLQDEQGNFEIVSALFGGSGLAPVVGDYDGDSRADPALYEEATGNWLVMLSALGYGVANAVMGGPGSRPVPADYDGDGKTDLAIMDASGGWYYRLSGRSYALSGPDEFGQIGQPAPGDYDGDGKSDPAVKNSSGQWYFWLSGSSYTRAGPYALNGR